jgi:ABC-type nitrate/sulfonate/bicarbonate transport system permease component
MSQVDSRWSEFIRDIRWSSGRMWLFIGLAVGLVIGLVVGVGIGFSIYLRAGTWD